MVFEIGYQTPLGGQENQVQYGTVGTGVVPQGFNALENHFAVKSVTQQIHSKREYVSTLDEIRRCSQKVTSGSRDLFVIS